MKRVRGFTLIEILAAVAVLAIALSAILAGMTHYASTANRLQLKTVALWVAHNRLTELELQSSPPATGISDGTTDMAGQKWKWFVDVKSTPDARLRRVDIRVQINDNEGDLATLSAFFPSGQR
jgi:general secretion pathway protein I